MKKRTDIDFSQHEVLVTELEGLKIHHLKKPDTILYNIKYINCGGVLTVTGDFGNWVFCREFHPSADGCVYSDYWDEKLEIGSEQKSHKYDPEETLKRIETFKSNFEYDFGRPMNEDELEWVERLEYNAGDEHEYVYWAYRETPRSLDFEDIPYGTKRHFWLDAVYDGFDEMCSRL